MPFIKLYTAGVSDINYLNWPIAVLFVGISFFEIIHLPSGNIINMSGRFRISRNFQIIAAIVLIISMIGGNYFFGFYGIIGAVFITAIVLAILEITYIHNIYFKKGLLDFFRCLMPNLFLSIILVIIEIAILPNIQGYLKFALIGVILTVINGSMLIAFNYLINKKLMTGLYKRFYPFADKLRETLFNSNNSQV
jgi:hypothetical protein